MRARRSVAVRDTMSLRCAVNASLSRHHERGHLLAQLLQGVTPGHACLRPAGTKPLAEGFIMLVQVPEKSAYLSLSTDIQGATVATVCPSPCSCSCDGGKGVSPAL